MSGARQPCGWLRLSRRPSAVRPRPRPLAREPELRDANSDECHSGNACRDSKANAAPRNSVMRWGASGATTDFTRVIRRAARRSTKLTRGTRGGALAPHEVPAAHSHQLWRASSPVRFWTKLIGPRNSLPRLLKFHGSQLAQPDIAETHGAAVTAEGQGAFADLVLVFRQD